MSSYPYLYTQTYSYTPFFSLVMPVLALLVIVAGGLALYFLFVRKPNTYKGPAASLHDILTFRTFFTEKLIRVLYCIAAVAIAVYSVMLLFSHFFAALFVFVVGNLVARITFEYALLLLVLCRNTQEINRKLGPLPAEEATPQAPAQEAAPPVPPQPPEQAPVPPQPQDNPPQ